MLSSGAGFRGVSSILSLITKTFGSLLGLGIAPAANSIKQWLLKLGLFKLNRPKDKSGTWIHIVDTTIQMGAQKAVLVLGLRIDGGQGAFSPTFANVEPLVLKTVTSCPGEVIMAALEQASEKTGAPACVLSDEGSENTRGVKLLTSKAPVIHLYDCLHKVSNVLKATFKGEERWDAFKNAATAMTQNVKLSRLAHLSPPKQRAKARLMASASSIEWGLKLLAYVDSGPDLDAEQVAKLNWIREYRDDLPDWMAMQSMANTAIKVVLESGYHANTAIEWQNRIFHVTPRTAPVKSVYEGIRSFLAAESAKVPKGQNYPGCTSVIESVFGKFKSLEGAFAQFGLTELVLALPALVGLTTREVVEEAMIEVSKNDVDEWFTANLGSTYLCNRRAALN